MRAPIAGYSGTSGRPPPPEAEYRMRYIGAGVNRNTLDPSNGLIVARTGGGPAFTNDPCPAGLTAIPAAAVCIDASATPFASSLSRPSSLSCPAGESVARGRVGFVTLAA